MTESGGLLEEGDRRAQDPVGLPVEPPTVPARRSNFCQRTPVRVRRPFLLVLRPSLSYASTEEPLTPAQRHSLRPQRHLP